MRKLPPPAAGLRQAIRLPQATALVVGSIIGASIFVQPSEIAARAPSLAGTALVWLAAGLLTFLGALVCAELAALLPHSGGVYVYLKQAWSPAVGFLWGWAMFWIMHSGILAAIAVVFARYLGYFLELSPGATKGAAVAAVAAISSVNYFGVRHGSNLQTLVTAAKVLAIALMIVLGFALGEPATGTGAATAPGGLTLSDFLLGVSAGLFAFGGWHMVTYTAGETVDARRTLPRALTLGVLVVTACYIALNAVYFYVLPLETVISSSRVAADAADAVVGGGGGGFMAALVVLSTFGALAGIVLAGPRVYFAMARDGLLFGWLGEVHPRWRTPHRAIVLQALWTSVLVATGTYRALFTRVVYTEWIFFGLMALGVLVLRRRPGLVRGFSVPVWVPVVFALAAFAVVANHVITDPRESLAGLALVAAGLPVYYVWGRRQKP